uniref:Uncharacterized protein n=2 Tax=Oryza TaxID=4527 RepID=A0A0E0N4D2_ORYRU
MRTYHNNPLPLAAGRRDRSSMGFHHLSSACRQRRLLLLTLSTEEAEIARLSWHCSACNAGQNHSDVYERGRQVSNGQLR